MAKKPIFYPGEVVLLDGSEVTISCVTWATNLMMYVIDVFERPETFFFEDELCKTERQVLVIHETTQHRY